MVEGIEKILDRKAHSFINILRYLVLDSFNKMAGHTTLALYEVHGQTMWWNAFNKHMIE